MTPERIIAESPRLFLYRLDPSDDQHFYHLNSDPEVMQYTGDEPFASIEHARTFLENYDVYERTGMGRWGLWEKSLNRFIGFSGLKLHANKQVDLGFRIVRDAWGNGYATEAGQACLRYGFENLSLAKIIARVHHKNSASIRVLEKLGMSRSNSPSNDPFCDLCYEIHSNDYNR